MRDPVERMVQFIQEQKRQAAFEKACSVWSRRIPALLPCVREVVEVFQSGLGEGREGPIVSVLADPHHDLCPLVIAFEPRDYEHPGIVTMLGEAAGKEMGASAAFRCGPDGIVQGIRYPFHDVEQDVRPVQFADLGEPELVQPEQLGNAVVDFLEWAAVGDGCGSRRLRFGSTVVAPQPIRLSIVAA